MDIYILVPTLIWASRQEFGTIFLHIVTFMRFLIFLGRPFILPRQGGAAQTTPEGWSCHNWRDWHPTS